MRPRAPTSAGELAGRCFEPTHERNHPLAIDGAARRRADEEAGPRILSDRQIAFEVRDVDVGFEHPRDHGGIAVAVEQHEAIDLNEAHRLIVQIGMQLHGTQPLEAAAAELAGDVPQDDIDGMHATRRLLGNDAGLRFESPRRVSSTVTR